MGDYARGFQEHEWAWRLFHWKGFATIGDVDRLNHLPLWRGERDARVLAYHELGHGDAIMAMRFLDEMASRAEVTLVIDQILSRAAGAAIRGQGDAAAARRHHAVRLSPAVLRGDERVEGGHDDSPGGAVYPTAFTRRPVNAVPKIGIAWSGRTQTDFTLRRFLSMLAHTGHHLAQPAARHAQRLPCRTTARRQ